MWDTTPLSIPFFDDFLLNECCWSCEKHANDDCAERSEGFADCEAVVDEEDMGVDAKIEISKSVRNRSDGGGS